MYPAFGSLYPEGCMELAQVDNEDAIAAKLEPYGTYRQLWDNAEVKAVESVAHILEGDEDLLGGGDSDEEQGGGHAPVGGMAAGITGVKDITQAFFEHSVKVLEGAFQGQFHYGKWMRCISLIPHFGTAASPSCHVLTMPTTRSHLLCICQAERAGSQEPGLDGNVPEAREARLRSSRSNLQKGGLKRKIPQLRYDHPACRKSRVYRIRTPATVPV